MLVKYCSMAAAWFSVVLQVTQKLVLSIGMGLLPFFCILQANVLTSLSIKKEINLFFLKGTKTTMNRKCEL